MVSKRDNKLVLWPVYFDVAQSRPKRKVPKNLAVHEPTAEAIANVAAKLRLNPVLERGAAHPSSWWKRDGRVLVDIRGSKPVLLRQIAEGLKARIAETAAKK